MGIIIFYFPFCLEKPVHSNLRAEQQKCCYLKTVLISIINIIVLYVSKIILNHPNFVNDEDNFLLIVLWIIFVI